MAFKFANRVSVLLASSVSAGATTLTVESGGGSKFPLLQTDDIAQVAVISTTGNVEIMSVTQVTGDVLTVIRAQESTAAQSFAAGSRVEMRVTSAILSNFLQRTGGVMLGDIDMSGNVIRNFVFGTPIVQEIIHAQLIRRFDIPPTSPYTVGEKAIYLPPGGGRPQVDNFVILTADMLQHVIFDAFVELANIPAHFRLCDGTNGTPDLRGKFTRGPTLEEPPGTTGGSLSKVTEEGGNHNHTGVTGLTELNAGNLPAIKVTSVQQPVQSGSGFFRLTDLKAEYVGGAIHQHQILFGGVHFHNINNIQPPYVVVAKVMLRL